jgi:predicted enzyme involved in methoxymalonyl-ACP biosynthesis
VSPPGGISQRAAIAELNTFVASELDSVGNAWLVDTTQCLVRVGAKDFYDWRYWHMAHAPYGRSALAELACEVQKHVRAETGRVRKCLILDCDNTLWGGIVGEDGVNGIRIGAEHPGTAYRKFQLEVLNLYHRGVILGLCSKNNHEDVLEVLRSRSDMVLREEHFAAMRAWRRWRWHLSTRTHGLCTRFTVRAGATLPGAPSPRAPHRVEEFAQFVKSFNPDLGLLP